MADDDYYDENRSGYDEDADDENNAAALYQASVQRAINGKRGQWFLRELAAVLDAMPEKRLIARHLVKDGAACAIGAVCLARGMSEEQIKAINVFDAKKVAATVGIAEAMAREIEYQNDDVGYWRPSGKETPEQRWERMRRWVEKNTLAEQPE